VDIDVITLRQWQNRNAGRPAARLLVRALHPPGQEPKTVVIDPSLDKPALLTAPAGQAGETTFVALAVPRFAADCLSAEAASVLCGAANSGFTVKLCQRAPAEDPPAEDPPRRWDDLPVVSAGWLGSSPPTDPRRRDNRVRHGLA
jgi:hypothetical protein